MMDTFEEIFEQKVLAVFFEVFGIDVIDELLRPDFEWHEAGNVLDVEMMGLFPLTQVACTLRGLALTTNIPVGTLKKAKLLNFWFDEELNDHHLTTLAKTFVEEAIIRINRFLLDPATGVMINPGLARNRFLMPLLAKLNCLWSDKEMTDAEKAKMNKEFKKESERLAKEIQISTSGYEIGKQLLKAIKMPRDQLTRKLKLEGIDIKEIGKASTKKKIRIIKVLKEIKRGEVERDTEKLEKKLKEEKSKETLKNWKRN